MDGFTMSSLASIRPWCMPWGFGGSLPGCFLVLDAVVHSGSILIFTVGLWFSGLHCLLLFPLSSLSRLLIWGVLDIILVHFTFLDSTWLLAVLGEECWGRTCLHVHKREKKELVTNQNNTKWLVSHPVLVSQMTFQFSASFTSWIVTPVSTFLNHTHVETHTKRNQCVTSC